MSAAAVSPRESDARLWLVALLASLGVNVAVILVLGLLAIRSLIFSAPVPQEEAAGVADKRVITLQPVTRAEEEAPPAAKPKPMDFARTSADQESGIPENPDFVGERDTLATSDRAPNADAPDLPSQSGIEPRVEDEMETTESDYQDGVLEHENPAGAPAEPAPPVEVAKEASPVDPLAPPPVEMPEEGDPGGERERLAESPLSVDLPVPPEMAEEEPNEIPEVEKAEPDEELVEESVKEEKPAEPSPQPGADPGFRGFQRKTELKGSISRSGRSALDVKSGPLGKYHAALSRAIEQAWQRQVVRNRDFIMPGVLRIRVVLDENGQVRSVGTVEEFGVGKVQVGFTHAAIREADLPELPAEVKRELGGEPLELLYNFIF